MDKTGFRHERKNVSFDPARRLDLLQSKQTLRKIPINIIRIYHIKPITIESSIFSKSTPRYNKTSFLKWIIWA